MKRLVLLLVAVFSWIFLPAQKVQWTWISGDSTGNNLDVYGNKRMLDPVNKPGSLSPLNTWTDKAGNFYMFGGSTLGIRFGFDTISVFSNGLWKYSPVLNAWAMVTGDNSTIPATSGGGSVYGTPGVPAPDNTPGRLEYSGSTSTDAAGNWWMFGGKTGYRDFGTSSELWKFDPVIAQWTYLNGGGDDSRPSYGTKGVPASSNSPGARTSVTTWNDQEGNLYMYGGYLQLYRTSYGDVWKYDQATKVWTWVSGRQWYQGISDGPVYGTKEVFAADNTPGAGYGGMLTGPDSNGIISMSISGEVWKFSLKVNQWAWISGDRTTNPNPAPEPKRSYGIKGIPSASNNPGPREDAAMWKDTAGNLWTFGGNIKYYLSNGNAATGYLNDLWKYTKATGEWTWVDGDSSINRLPDYGIKGTPLPTNQPGGRSSWITWKDAQGNFWLFGGTRQLLKSTSSSGIYKNQLNDLWKLHITEVAAPVKLNGFSAVQKDEQVVLHWNTSQEQNSKEFIVERSPDGIRFTTIGTVSAAANASTITQYQFSDNAPLNGSNFYRLKQVDLDNTFDYSAIVKVFVETAGFTYRIMQNPALNELRIVLETGQAMTVQVQVHDATGHLMMKKNIIMAQGTSNYTIPVKQLAAGVYLISISNDKKTITKRFSK